MNRRRAYVVFGYPVARLMRIWVWDTKMRASSCEHDRVHAAFFTDRSGTARKRIRESVCRPVKCKLPRRRDRMETSNTWF